MILKLYKIENRINMETYRYNLIFRYRVASNLRESFLLDYGTVLMENKSLWQVGLSYLDHCPIEGIHRAEILLGRLSLETEARTFKIIREAEKRELHNVGM